MEVFIFTTAVMGLFILTFVIGNLKNNASCVLTIAAFIQPIGFWVAYYTSGKIVCPYCRNTIPEKAIICGYCQKESSYMLTSLKSRDKKHKIIGILGILLTIMFFIGIISLQSNKVKSDKVVPVIITFLADHPEFGVYESVVEMPDWGEGKRQQVTTSNGSYLFYLTNDYVITVYRNDASGRKEVWRINEPINY